MDTKGKRRITALPLSVESPHRVPDPWGAGTGIRSLGARSESAARVGDADPGSTAQRIPRAMRPLATSPKLRSSLLGTGRLGFYAAGSLIMTMEAVNTHTSMPRNPTRTTIGSSPLNLRKPAMALSPNKATTAER